MRYWHGESGKGHYMSNRNRSHGAGSASAKNRKRKGMPRRRSAVIPLARLPRGGVSLLGHGGQLQPPCMRVPMRFYFQYQVSNGGLQTASKSFYCNSVYDVDPALGSNTVPGFTQFIGLYNTFRVERCTLTMDASNGDSFATSLVVAWFPNATFSAVNSFLEHSYGNRFTSRHMLSAVGGMDRCRIHRSVDMGDLYGDKTSYYGSVNNFQGTGASNPQSLFTVCIGATPAHAVPFVNGVYVNGYLDFIVDFFDPANLLDV